LLLQIFSQDSSLRLLTMLLVLFNGLLQSYHCI
jgi:hypothetical protein